MAEQKTAQEFKQEIIEKVSLAIKEVENELGKYLAKVNYTDAGILQQRGKLLNQVLTIVNQISTDKPEPEKKED